jgi:two-component system, OmpR family, sensor histidine kinase KdpD
MAQGQRPDPDALLARVQSEDQKENRGKLKIFLGYAAGVGKTFAMLEAARRRLSVGDDVVAAYVETHGRRETDALLAGLPAIPRRVSTHRGIQLQELDLDAVLARKPRLALVDELAHTNAPGSRHLKRWQDVEELLAAGIDVFTTLNIQHLESLTDVVAQITGVVMRETIPDRILDEAGEIELVDLPPPELLQRLREGKVYLPEQAARAARQYFRSGNLIALREIALRRAARRVDEEMRAYMKSRAIPGPWPVTERLLVCVSGSPYSERLIRAASRLAAELRAEWFAVYVDTPGSDRLAQENREYVWRDLRLAESLGATVATLTSHSPTEAIPDFARKRNVTKIVIGKPVRWRLGFWPGRTIVDRLIRSSPAIDVVVVDIAPAANAGKRPRAAWVQSPVHSYTAAVALVALATLVCSVFHLFLAPTNLVMIYLLAVVLAALRLGLRPAILAALLGVLAFDFFFVPPPFTLAVNDTQYLITFAGLFTVGVVVSTLVAKARAQAEAVQAREAQTVSLYALSRDLAVAADLETIAGSVVRHVGDSLEAQAAVLLPGAPGLTVLCATPGLALEEKERAVAQWAFHNGRAAGAGTDTLSSAEMRHIPLRSMGGIAGVLAVKFKDRTSLRPMERAALLEAFANQAASAMERVALARKAGQAKLLEEADKLHRAILSSISHDLRTPLVTITGALSSLREEGDRLPEPHRRDLVEGAWEEAGRLNQFVGNLLEMSRLEAGVLRTRLEPCDVQDLFGSAARSLAGRLEGRPVRMEISPDLPLVAMDFVLMKLVVANLLDNAIKYSPPDAPIELRAGLAKDGVELSVADRGPGIPEDDLDRIFDKFYRARRAGDVAGTGLGLAISRGVVEAHGGTIRAENRPDGGARLVIFLPLAAAGAGTAPTGCGEGS